MNLHVVQGGRPHLAAFDRAMDEVYPHERVTTSITPPGRTPERYGSEELGRRDGGRGPHKTAVVSALRRSDRA